MTRVLLTGASGQVGCYVKHYLSLSGIKPHTPRRALLDISDYNSVADYVRSVRPDIIINSAAYTDVDRAEFEPTLAMEVNAKGPANLARIANLVDAALIHISSDYVFNGVKQEDWREQDPIDPINRYGQSKAAGDLAVRTEIQKHIIIRTSWVFSALGRNFVKSIVDLALTQPVLKVVADQHGSPTSADDLGKTISIIAHKLERKSSIAKWGTYHYTNRGQATWYDIASEVLEVVAQRHGAVANLQAIHSDEYRTTARRPANSTLNCDLFDKTFSIGRRHWREAAYEATQSILTRHSRTIATNN